MTVVADYLHQFCKRAAAKGLALKQPGSNFVAMRDLVPGSHVSLSVRRDQIQVNLNNEGDHDRRRFDALFSRRAELGAAIDEPLTWEKKEGRKKTAVRATLNRGYEEQGDWAGQHDWAIKTMEAFVNEFGRVLRGQ